MNIELNSEDLRRMPQTLSANLLTWLQYERLKPSPRSNSSAKTDVQQLSLVSNLSQGSQPSRISADAAPKSKTSSYGAPQISSAHTHVKLSQLLDAGITRTGMAVRVRLKQELATQRGHEYVTKGVAISPRGTVVYKGQEFDKPSPLAKQVNSSAVNGWEYVEVMKDGQWVCLDELRKIWRNAS